MNKIFFLIFFFISQIIFSQVPEPVSEQDKAIILYNAEVHVGDQKKKQELIQFLNKRYGRFYKNKIAVHFSLDDVGDYWLNLDWTAKHPGGKYYKSDHETIYYPTQNYYVMTK